MGLGSGIEGDGEDGDGFLGLMQSREGFGWCYFIQWRRGGGDGVRIIMFRVRVCGCRFNKRIKGDKGWAWVLVLG